MFAGDDTEWHGPYSQRVCSLGGKLYSLMYSINIWKLTVGQALGRLLGYIRGQNAQNSASENLHPAPMCEESVVKWSTICIQKRDQTVRTWESGESHRRKKTFSWSWPVELCMEDTLEQNYSRFFLWHLTLKYSLALKNSFMNRKIFQILIYSLRFSIFLLNYTRAALPGRQLSWNSLCLFGARKPVEKVISVGWVLPLLQASSKVNGLNHPFSMHSTSFAKWVQTFGNWDNGIPGEKYHCSSKCSDFPTFTEFPVLFFSFWMKRRRRKHHKPTYYGCLL